MTVSPEKKLPIKWEYIVAALCAIWGIWLFLAPGGAGTAPIANPTVSMTIGVIFLIVAAYFGYRGSKRKE